MTHLITLPLEAPPETISVALDFYDDDEKRAFQQSPMTAVLADLPRTIVIPTPDFCAYYLYYKKRPGVPGHSTYDDVAEKWATALTEFDGQVQFTNSSLNLIQRTGFNTGTTERLGEAIGLSTASCLHSLHQADWTRIPITTRRQTLDFWHPWTASDGRQFVQVETKGATVEDNSVVMGSIPNHKRSIKDKKAAATPLERQSSILYGTIGVLDPRPNSVMKCWLVDPPANVPDNAERFQIVTRLTYIANLISMLAPNSSLAASLQTRLAALNALSDIVPLDALPLRKGNGESFSTEIFGAMTNRNPLFQGKSVVIDGPVGGQVSVVDKSCLLFIGMREELIAYAIRQLFADIQNYQFRAATLEKSVECVIPVGRFKREFLRFINTPDGLQRRTPGYVRFRLQGQLHYTRSGLVFGVLPIPEDWQTTKP